MLACLSLSQAEDLTTLDGHTFTNITEISKYATMVVFTSNGQRKGVTITNLPEAFRAKYGVVIKTNAPAVATVKLQPQLSPVDSFLFQQKDIDVADLMECDGVNIHTNDEVTSWQLCLSGVEVSLTSYLDYTNGTRKRQPQRLKFQIGQDVIMGQVFDKFLEWDAIARTNKAQPFDKVITNYLNMANYNPNDNPTTRLSYTDSLVFHWQLGESYLSDSANAGIFYKNDILHFKDILPELESLKAKVVKNIKTKAAQTTLFK